LDQLKRTPAAYIAAAGLFAIAGITAWDASQMRQLNTYGIGPESASYLVAGFFALLGVGHIWQGFMGSFPKAPVADWKAVGWVAAALASLILVIEIGGGFILAATLLFAFTARSLGRRALLVDCFIGLVLATIVFLLFNNLLTLALPAGPLERLL
jgi:putative tricarboxylic transport membrane protein